MIYIVLTGIKDGRMYYFSALQDFSALKPRRRGFVEDTKTSAFQNFYPKVFSPV